MQTLRSTSRLFSGSLVLVVVAASAPVALAGEVNIDYDPGVDFSRFKTIGWLTGTPCEDPLVETTIRVAIERELVPLGFKEARTEPDLLLVTHGAVEGERQIVVQDFEYWTGYQGWKRPLLPAGEMAVLGPGTVIVDILDGSSEQLIWRGLTTGNVAKKPEKRDLKLNRAIAKMFRKFPPG